MHEPSTASFRLGDSAIHYLEAGGGSTVVLAHCSGGSHRGWAFLLPSLATQHRVLAPDLLGYGRSSPWPVGKPESLPRDPEVIEAMIERAQGSVHLVGHSYGAAVCLEVARRDALKRAGRVLSLCLVEPVAFHLLREVDRQGTWPTVERLAARVERHVERGELDAAARVFMGFWLGYPRWFLSSRRFRARVAKVMPKVAAEFRQLLERGATLADHGAIACPVTLVQGGKSPEVTHAVTQLLAATLPDVRVAAIPGAGHMSPFTHPGRLRTVIDRHLARAPAPRREAQSLERLSA